MGAPGKRSHLPENRLLVPRSKVRSFCKERSYGKEDIFASFRNPPTEISGPMRAERNVHAYVIALRRKRSLPNRTDAVKHLKLEAIGENALFAGE